MYLVAPSILFSPVVSAIISGVHEFYRVLVITQRGVYSYTTQNIGVISNALGSVFVNKMIQPVKTSL